MQSKLYKKGIKTADAILKKCPNNGETLAMKGLLFNCLNKKEEAYQLVKEGVKNNLRSHVCWHVYGYVATDFCLSTLESVSQRMCCACRLVYRSDRNYDEAIKCYKNSLRMDKDNLTVLRDLAQLQIQMRDIKGFLESRQRLLELKPTVRQGWVSLALAHHLEGNYDVAAVILDQYETTLDSITLQAEPYEHSEILLYKVTILQEGEKYEEALHALDIAEEAGYIKDIISALEIRAQILMSLGKFSDAAGIYSRLLDINIENYRYHEGLMKALDSEEGNLKGADQLVRCYKELQGKYPSSTACKRIPLDFLTGDAFTESLCNFIMPYVEKGIPSLFSELKPLYRDSEKVEIIGQELRQLTGKLEGQTLSWVYLCLSLHYCELGMHSDALETIEKCMDIQPNLIEAYSTKSKILDDAGDVYGAALFAEHARKMDLADRYLNCQASTALFKSMDAEKAEKISHLFTKIGDQGNNFYDMQATWYEIASGNCYLAMKDYGQALKRFKKIDEHFSDFMEDQFDFHGYCVRKQTMRAYVNVLRMLDNLYSNKVYAIAVEAAVTIYIHLFEHPFKSDEQLLEERLVGLSPEEAKKEKQKFRKKAKKDVEAAKDAANAPSKNAQGQRIDPDPKGYLLLQTPNPLEEASKMVKNLLSGAPDRVKTHAIAYNVDIRRGKVLLAFKHVHNAIRIASRQSAVAHECLMDLVLRVSSENFQPLPKLGEIIKEEANALLDGVDPKEYHDNWKRQNSDTFDLDSAFICAKVDAMLDSFGKERIWNSFVDALRPEIISGSTHAQCETILRELEGRVEPVSPILESYKKVCGMIYPYSRTFMGNKCTPAEELEAHMNSLTL